MMAAAASPTWVPSSTRPRLSRHRTGAAARSSAAAPRLARGELMGSRVHRDGGLCYIGAMPKNVDKKAGGGSPPPPARYFCLAPPPPPLSSLDPHAQSPAARKPVSQPVALPSLLATLSRGCRLQGSPQHHRDVLHPRVLRPERCVLLPWRSGAFQSEGKITRENATLLFHCQKLPSGA